MAWLEPLIATVPSLIATNTIKDTSIPNLDEKDDSLTHMNNCNGDHGALIHNRQVVSMYQRAMTLQQTNTEDMNRQIFESPSIFDRDSLMERSYSFGSKHELDEGVVSDEQYVDLHSRLSLDELSSELYETNTWPWFEMNLKDNELIVNNKKKKLSEEQWQSIMHTMDHKYKELQDRNITLTMHEVVLDKTAARYMHKLSLKMKQNNVKLTTFHIESAYFTTTNDDDQFVLFSQTEGGMNEADDAYEDEDLFLNDNCFDFNVFCDAILGVKTLHTLIVNNTNLDLNDGSSYSWMKMLSNHNGLRTVDLSQNNISNGSFFVDVLLGRQIPLQCLNVSHNPICPNDIKTIQWAATKQYVWPFAIQPQHETCLGNDEEKFVASLFPIQGQSKVHLKSIKHKTVMCDKFIFTSEDDEKPPGVELQMNSCDIDDTSCNDHCLMLRI
eukprot:165902_1